MTLDHKELPREEQDYKRLYPDTFDPIHSIPIILTTTATDRFGKKAVAITSSPRRQMTNISTSTHYSTLFIPCNDKDLKWSTRLQHSTLPKAHFTVNPMIRLAKNTENIESSVEIAVPIKRGRGRPPKNAPRTDIVSLDVDQFGVEIDGCAYIGRYDNDYSADVEYDMDEQDIKWLTALNNERILNNQKILTEESFEFVIDFFERRWFDLTKAMLKWNARVDDCTYPEGELQCEICADSDTSNANVLVLCDGCDLAVHQECYGVPHVPEGPWLCRKCMLLGGVSSNISSASSLTLSSSSTEPSLCALCPWPGGALKQTTDRRWVHSACAHWSNAHILNTIYQEPVDLTDIHKQQWKLRCSLCKIPAGAPIQCSHEKCSIAYHVMCARKLGLYLDYKSKQSYCWKHTPASHQAAVKGAMSRIKDRRDSTFTSDNEDIDILSEDPEPLTRPFTTLSSPPRAMVKIGEFPPLHVPRRPSRPRLKNVIPKLIIDELMKEEQIKNSVLSRELVCKLARYWSLKREARRGTPLLKRLQLEPISSTITTHDVDMTTTMLSEHKTKLYLINDLKQLAHLTSLVCLRERKRLDLLETMLEMIEISEHPLNSILTRFTEHVISLDTNSYFLHPVSLEIAPDYLTFIKHPIDLSTILKNTKSNSYTTFDHYCKDLQRVWDNALEYNESTTVYYETARILKRRTENELKIVKRAIQNLNIKSNKDKLKI